ncbi:MAG TPA: DUF998 domain-containing protein [Candidatus Limnocylindrales bacterium]
MTPIGALVGMVGALFMSATMAITALVYVGTDGERYSPFNHFVSELGQVGVSRLALVHNAGQIVGGISFAIFIVALGLARKSALAWLFVPIGVLAGIGATFVGIFPMNQIRLHTLFALTFFVLGWIAVGLASWDFVRRRDPRFPWWLAAIGALTVLAFISFLVVVTPLFRTTGLESPPTRPDFWIVPTLEWAVVIGILIWTFASSFTWWRHDRGTRP